MELSRKILKVINFKKLKSLPLHNRRSIPLCIGPIIALYLVLSYFFAPGVVFSRPQDEGIYINNAMNILRSNSNYNRNLFYERYANPVEVIGVRLLFTSILSLSFIAFQISEYSAILFSFACSVLLIPVTFVIGKKLVNEKVGVLASFILLFMPVLHLFSARALPDIPMLLFMSASIASFLVAEDSKKPNKLYLLSGVLLGIGILIKELAVSAVLFYVLYAFVNRKLKRQYALVVLGVLLMLSLEAVAFYSLTGKPFYKQVILSKAHTFKYEVEYHGSVAYSPPMVDWLVFHFPQGYDFLYHTKDFFDLRAIFGGRNFFGIAGILFFLSMLLLSSFGGKKYRVLILWSLVTFLFLEFGPLEINFDLGSSTLNYYFIFKEVDSVKNAAIIIVPMSITISAFFMHLLEKNRKSDVLLLLLFAILAFYSLKSTYVQTSLLKDGVSDLKEAKNYLDLLFNKGISKNIFIDHYGAGILGFYYGRKFDDKIIPISPDWVERGISDSIIIAGGGRGIDLGGTDTMIVSSYGDLFTNPSTADRLVVLKVVEGVRAPYRARNLIIYYLPG